MVEIVAYEDAKSGRVTKPSADQAGQNYHRTSFITPVADEDPQAYLIEIGSDRTLEPHFHEVDQFQVFVGGGGMIGRHKIGGISAHYARAYTTYGPITTGADGLSWMTIRPHFDHGNKVVKDHKHLLAKAGSRKPYQATEMVDLAGLKPGADGVALVPVPALADAEGMSVLGFSLTSGARTATPDPSATESQFVLVTRGGILHGGQMHGALTVVHIRPGDGAFALMAGPEGAEGLVLNFARPITDEVTKAADAEWNCDLCGFVYDEAKGLPEDGIAPGTKWSDIPEDFTCPDCAASKAEFTAAR